MIIERDVPIIADDGNVLRADVFRPEIGGLCPVLMVLGPYGKGVEYREGYKSQWDWMCERHPDWLPGSTRSYMTWETVDPEIWVPWGYACIRVDARGTGRSPGFLDIYSQREVRDFYNAIEWAGTQPWSNGKVGLNGISYYAITQWQVAALNPPHLAAICPWEGAVDFYRDLYRHGGIISNAFFESWYAAQVKTNQHGNANGWTDPWMGEKATGPDVYDMDKLSTLRTNPLEEEAIARPLDDDYYHARTPDVSKIKVPLLSASNWGGLGLHGRGNFEGYIDAGSQKKWLEVHSGRHDEAFYTGRAMDLQKKFFDHFLREVDNGWDKTPPVLLQIRRPEQPFGEIREEKAWPLPQTQWTQMHISSSGNTLSSSAALEKSSLSFDASNEHVVFFSAPFVKPFEITGPMALKLHVSSSTIDADIFVTLQAFSPDGKEVEFQGGWDPHTPLSQGWLRASHRKLDTARTLPYRPYHSHDEQQPLEIDKIYELEVELWPTHIMLPAGYSIALDIGGTDFQRPAALANDSLNWRQKGSGPFLHTHPKDRGSDVFAGTTTIHTGPDTPSTLLLPVIPS